MNSSFFFTSGRLSDVHQIYVDRDLNAESEL